MKKAIIASLFLALASAAPARPQMQAWKSYFHQLDGGTHFSFTILDRKHGLFWGPCGPRLSSDRWLYIIDLAGSGRNYTSDKIRIMNPSDTEEPKQAPVSGQIVVDALSRRVDIRLQIAHKGAVRDFEGNGTYRMKEAP
jgi:hypothetical protein